MRGAFSRAAENGKAFVREQQVGGSMLVLFAADGTRRGVLQSVVDDRELRRALNDAFGLTP